MMMKQVEATALSVPRETDKKSITSDKFLFILVGGKYKAVTSQA